MALKVQSIDELDPALVEQAQAELSQLIQERHPEVELTRGVIHDIVAFFSGGISGGINQTEVDRVLQSRSLLAIEEDPLLADDELVDHVLSNFMITRKTGTRADGELTIVVTGDTSVVVTANQLYVANGLNFVVDEPIVAIPPGNTTTDPTERVLQPRGDGTFEFTVPVTAEEVGEAGNIRRGTKFDPDPVPDRFVTAFAANDFIGGTSTENNEDLISRLDEGIPAKVMNGRQNIVALLKDQAQFADTLHYSIIGYGDPEMERDQHWIFPVSGGGRMDIYARTELTPQTVTLDKLCTMIEILGTDTIWQFAINRDEAPGFYAVSQVRRPEDPVDQAGFAIVHDERGFDLGDDDKIPDILTVIEAAFTRYQTGVFRFRDTSTSIEGLTVGDTAEYNVGVQMMPQIRELQEFANSQEHTHLMSDVLVRAVVPCFLSINCDVVKDVSETAPDLDTIKNDLAALVNKLDFPGVLYASQIADVIHNSLSGSMAVGPIEMHGRIRRVDGSEAIIRDNQVLWLPNSPSTLVTGNTATFILYAEDIGLNVVNRG